MKFTFRAAAALLGLFCAGHTAGTLAGRSPGGAADAVLAAMKEVHFDFNGSDRTFYEVFFGHSLLVSVHLAGCVLLAVWLSGLDAARWRAVAPVAWGLTVSQFLVTVIVGGHFFLGPTVLCGLSALLLAVGSIAGARTK